MSDDDAKAAEKARKAAKAAKKAAAALQSTPTNSDSGDVPDRPSTPTKNFSVDNLAALAKLKENAKEAKKKSGGSSAADDSGDGSASDAQSKWLVDNEVKIHDSAVETKVCLDFNAAPFPKTLITLLNKQGFPSPSAVQGAAWPVSMTGTDVLAIAKTGSGKTLGYLLPALTIAAEHKHASKGRPLAFLSFMGFVSNSVAMVRWVVWRGVARNGREKTTIVRFELSLRSLRSCEPQISRTTKYKIL